MPEDIIKAHAYCNNKEALAKDKICGCFYCCEIFNPDEINEWIPNETTAMCPYCGIDSVISESSGYPITKEFLVQMKKHWFDEDFSFDEISQSE
ncbi:MAG: cytoplasmic protein [Alphaproteobacteria bacterium]|nr:cytoplasmic protein [Alphaproteobacteria bacterium]MCL2757731.1 cytoplasmic protein [Alphaproteobacteria bacterium]